MRLLGGLQHLNYSWFLVDLLTFDELRTSSIILGEMYIHCKSTSTKTDALSYCMMYLGLQKILGEKFKTVL